MESILGSFSLPLQEKLDIRIVLVLLTVDEELEAIEVIISEEELAANKMFIPLTEEELEGIIPEEELETNIVLLLLTDIDSLFLRENWRPKLCPFYWQRRA